MEISQHCCTCKGYHTQVCKDKGYVQDMEDIKPNCYDPVTPVIRLLSEIVVLIENGHYLFMQFSDDSDYENYDYCIDYTIYDSDKKEIDGGVVTSYDYSGEFHGTIIDTIPDIIQFHYDKNMSFEVTDLTREEFE